MCAPTPIWRRSILLRAALVAASLALLPSSPTLAQNTVMDAYNAYVAAQESGDVDASNQAYAALETECTAAGFDNVNACLGAGGVAQAEAPPPPAGPTADELAARKLSELAGPLADYDNALSLAAGGGDYNQARALADRVTAEITQICANYGQPSIEACIGHPLGTFPLSPDEQFAQAITVPLNDYQQAVDTANSGGDYNQAAAAADAATQQIVATCTHFGRAAEPVNCLGYNLPPLPAPPSQAASETTVNPGPTQDEIDAEFANLAKGPVDAYESAIEAVGAGSDYDQTLAFAQQSLQSLADICTRYGRPPDPVNCLGYSLPSFPDRPVAADPGQSAATPPDAGTPPGPAPLTQEQVDQYTAQIQAAYGRYTAAIDQANGGDYAGGKAAADGAFADLSAACAALGLQTVVDCIQQELPVFPAEPGPRATTPLEAGAPAATPPDAGSPPAPDALTDEQKTALATAGSRAYTAYATAISKANAGGDYATAKAEADLALADLQSACTALGQPDISTCISGDIPPFPADPGQAANTPDAGTAPPSGQAPDAGTPPASAPLTQEQIDKYTAQIQADFGRYTAAIDQANAGDYAGGKAAADAASADLLAACAAIGQTTIVDCIQQELSPFPPEPAPQGTTAPDAGTPPLTNSPDATTPPDASTPPAATPSEAVPAPEPGALTEEQKAALATAGSRAYTVYSTAISKANAGGDYAAAKAEADQALADLQSACTSLGQPDLSICIGGDLPAFPADPAQAAATTAPDAGTPPAPAPLTEEQKADLATAGAQAYSAYTTAISSVNAGGDYATAKANADQARADLQAACTGLGVPDLTVCIGANLPPFPADPAQTTASSSQAPDAGTPAATPPDAGTPPAELTEDQRSALKAEGLRAVNAMAAAMDKAKTGGDYASAKADFDRAVSDLKAACAALDSPEIGGCIGSELPEFPADPGQTNTSSSQAPDAGTPAATTPTGPVDPQVAGLLTKLSGVVDGAQRSDPFMLYFATKLVVQIKDICASLGVEINQCTGGVALPALPAMPLSGVVDSYNGNAQALRNGEAGRTLEQLGGQYDSILVACRALGFPDVPPCLSGQGLPAATAPEDIPPTRASTVSDATTRRAMIGEMSTLYSSSMLDYDAITSRGEQDKVESYNQARAKLYADCDALGFTMTTCIGSELPELAGATSSSAAPVDTAALGAELRIALQTFMANQDAGLNGDRGALAILYGTKATIEKNCAALNQDIKTCIGGPLPDLPPLDATATGQGATTTPPAALTDQEKQELARRGTAQAQAYVDAIARVNAGGDYAAEKQNADAALASLKQICATLGVPEIATCLGQDLAPFPADKGTQTGAGSAPAPADARAILQLAYNDLALNFGQTPGSPEHRKFAAAARTILEQCFALGFDTTKELVIGGPIDACLQSVALPARPVDMMKVIRAPYEKAIRDGAATYRAGAAKLAAGDPSGQAMIDSISGTLEHYCGLFLAYPSLDACLADLGIDPLLPLAAAPGGTTNPPAPPEAIVTPEQALAAYADIGKADVSGDRNKLIATLAAYCRQQGYPTDAECSSDLKQGITRNNVPSGNVGPGTPNAATTGSVTREAAKAALDATRAGTADATQTAALDTFCREQNYLRVENCYGDLTDGAVGIAREDLRYNLQRLEDGSASGNSDLVFRSWQALVGYCRNQGFEPKQVFYANGSIDACLQSFGLPVRSSAAVAAQRAPYDKIVGDALAAIKQALADIANGKANGQSRYNLARTTLADDCEMLEYPSVDDCVLDITGETLPNSGSPAPGAPPALTPDQLAAQQSKAQKAMDDYIAAVALAGTDYVSASQKAAAARQALAEACAALGDPEVDHCTGGQLPPFPPAAPATGQVGKGGLPTPAGVDSISDVIAAYAELLKQNDLAQRGVVPFANVDSAQAAFIDACTRQLGITDMAKCEADMLRRQQIQKAGFTDSANHAASLLLPVLDQYNGLIEAFLKDGEASGARAKLPAVYQQLAGICDADKLGDLASCFRSLGWEPLRELPAAAGTTAPANQEDPMVTRLRQALAQFEASAGIESQDSLLKFVQAREAIEADCGIDRMAAAMPDSRADDCLTAHGLLPRSADAMKKLRTAIEKVIRSQVDAYRSSAAKLAANSPDRVRVSAAANAEIGSSCQMLGMPSVRDCLAGLKIDLPELVSGDVVLALLRASSDYQAANARIAALVKSGGNPDDDRDAQYTIGNAIAQVTAGCNTIAGKELITPASPMSALSDCLVAQGLPPLSPPWQDTVAGLTPDIKTNLAMMVGDYNALIQSGKPFDKNGALKAIGDYCTANKLGDLKACLDTAGLLLADQTITATTAEQRPDGTTINNAAPLLDSAKGGGGGAGTTTPAVTPTKPVGGGGTQTTTTTTTTTTVTTLTTVPVPKTDLEAQGNLPKVVLPVTTKPGTVIDPNTVKFTPPRNQPSAPVETGKPGNKAGTTLSFNASVTPDGGFVFQLGAQVVISNPDQERGRLFNPTRNDRIGYESLAGNQVRETVTRQDGTRVVTIRGKDGGVDQRQVFKPSGKSFILAAGAKSNVGRSDGGHWSDPGDELPPLRLTIPARDYVLDTDGADEGDIAFFLLQPPVERVKRIYSIDEVKHSARLRDSMRRFEIGALTFDSGKSTLGEAQIRTLKTLADAMLELLARDPAETFLIEGHTDAVGAELSNLALSDSRANAVARILTDYFGVPPENLATQGYGETFLKVKTQDSERLNRRVTVRRITPLITVADTNG